MNEFVNEIQDSEMSNNLVNSEIVDDDSNDIFPSYKRTNNFKVNSNFESSDEECAPVSRSKKRLEHFTDSESDTENAQQNKNKPSDSKDVTKNAISSKIREGSTSSDDSDNDTPKINNEEQQLRMKNKRIKLRDKFKSLVTSRTKGTKREDEDTDKENDLNKNIDSLLELEVSKNILVDSKKAQNKNNDSSNESDYEETSINNIKKIIKKSMSFKPSICDPDTSDEEENENRRDRLVSKSLNKKKSTKPTSPKPIRMSAKQAMENMQKIKSESNRLLREKDISLPYHRPKAFSLRDIMSRRKPAVTADGKALPIKMNEEQLKQYAEMLEQRQKEIIELCKSDTDEEQDNSNVQGIQEKPLETCNSNVDTELLENNNNEPTNELADCFPTIKDLPSQENCKKSHEIAKPTDLLYHSSTEIDSTKIDVDKEGSLEENNIFINSTSNLENYMITDSTYKLNIVNKDDATKQIVQQNLVFLEKSVDEQMPRPSTEPDSQMINLHYDSEKNIADELKQIDCDTENVNRDSPKGNENDFSDDDMVMEDIDRLIENAEIINDITQKDKTKSSIFVGASSPLNIKPKLTGAPGMVIDLDGSDSVNSTKLSGVELLKERFTYFSKLKTPEEMEREREKKLKPGAQHLKLRQELEESIAEQRSLEWAKRLNEEKQQQMELKALRGEGSDSEDDIEKIEAQIEEKDVEREDTSEEEQESEPEEDDLDVAKEKPRVKNPMIDDEAEESDCDDEDIEEKHTDINGEDNDANNKVDEDNYASCEEQSSEESSEVESENEEQTTKTRKGRILKAFEDSDDETVGENEIINDNIDVLIEKVNQKEHSDGKIGDNDSIVEKTTVSNVNFDMDVDSENGSQILKDSQDEEIQLAQRVVSVSDDLFTSQESAVMGKGNSQYDGENVLGTQTFSILNSNNSVRDVLSNLQGAAKLSFMSDIQTLDSNLDAAVALCPGSFTNNLIPSQLISSQLPIDQSQAIGEDVLALCTGNFYDNQFISQSEENKPDSENLEEAINDNFDDSWSKGDVQESDTDILIYNSNKLQDNSEPKNEETLKDNNNPIDKGIPKSIDKENVEDENILQSIIDELNDDEKIDSLKPNKFFVGNDEKTDANNQLKKKFVIESDDEFNEDLKEEKKRKKLKKKKLEQRALQISDDEEEKSSDDAEEYMSDIQDDTERIVDYDSEENEIEVKQQKPKKKRKVADFFENEAELTSEDEWVGSGDEDEAGLDRMEREEGDDETFHQGKLQRELGQIHMRDVLDQDKREVRIIQELLFEDGDLGDGHRQRKFRWRNADGGEDTDTIVGEFADTQEEEFESEEQWRKQRHEREVFLREMQERDKKEDSPNISVNRSTIIKANLSSKTMSSLLLEVNNRTIKNTAEKRTEVSINEKSTKDIPSPKKGFTILQQNYHSSLLTRGRGALARLAALATPLAIDEDSTKVATVAPKNQRNFVFTAISKDDEPKFTKRKADSKLDTPRLVKKLKTNEKHALIRNSLLDHLRV